MRLTWIAAQLSRTRRLAEVAANMPGKTNGHLEDVAHT